MKVFSRGTLGCPLGILDQQIIDPGRSPSPEPRRRRRSRTVADRVRPVQWHSGNDNNVSWICYPC